MVCVFEEDANAFCIIKDMTSASTHNENDPSKFTYAASTTVEELFQEIGNKYNYDPDSFDLVLNGPSEDKTVILNNHKEKTIKAAGVICKEGFQNIVMVKDKENQPPRVLAATPGGGDGSAGEDDMLLGASASPTATTASDFPSTSVSHQHQPLPRLTLNSTSLNAPSSTGEFNNFTSALIKHDTGYVGLVNQAMTCYLNSLLQTLYMTPEFRNALYNWKFNGSKEEKYIPFQLQKLFLLLQTSKKSAVETTELTLSFGWDLREAWQQHDVQELCRIMFDALEQTFKETEQSDLILKLYEGKMIDYVKCLDCGTEKSREDTFLDIPLAVRPFGSQVAYGSVEEALNAFVQPETLNGNNQYHCEKCNKKCDAQKWLKFSKFPYLLTLHLKRFDFDSTTFHRIKLNDKVVFLETLNLNNFVASGGVESENGLNHLSNATARTSASTGCEHGDVGLGDESAVKCDDSSTTDSGSALDDESSQGPEASLPSVSLPLPSPETVGDSQEDDEGIDVSIGATGAAGNSQSGLTNENDRNHQQEGPYIYELFSIMIHSGSASGGHYYAYIKDLKKGEWYCFNDQSVTRITLDDIYKTYGGGPNRGYYSAYTSSTNAYMLMYRQIDPERNCNAMTENDFPPHLQELLKKIQEREEIDRLWRERELDMCNLNIFCHHPEKDQIIEKKIHANNKSTLLEVTDQAYEELKLNNILPRERCRLVNYDRINDSIECSFENRCDDSIGDIMDSLRANYKHDLLLDIRGERETFRIYLPGGFLTKVYIVDLKNEELDGPRNVRGTLEQTVGDFKKRLLTELKNELNCTLSNLQVVLEKRINESRLITDDLNTLKEEGFYNFCKVFVSMNDDPNLPFEDTKLYKLIDRFEHIITLHITLPDTDKATLEKLKIPPLVPEIVTHEEGGGAGGGGEGDHSQAANVTTPIANEGEDEATGATGGAQSDQSASEDSSLTDSDRTIVGDAPDECDAQVSSPSNSSIEEMTSVYTRTYPPFIKSTENWDVDNDTKGPIIVTNSNSRGKYYIRVTPYKDGEIKKLKVIVDKRIVVKVLQKEIEKYIGVSCKHFKLFNNNSVNSPDFMKSFETLTNYKNEERLNLQLERVLRSDEFQGKVFYLQPNNPEPYKYLFGLVLSNSMTVAEAKQEILEEYKNQYNKEIPLKKCRLRTKLYKEPGKIYTDDQKFNLNNNWELSIQELPEEDLVTKESQVVVFIRQWSPSKYSLGPLEELVLEDKMEDIRTRLAEVSNIPYEEIEFAKLDTSIWSLSVINIHTDHEWITEPSTLAKLSIRNMDVIGFLYLDRRETLKILSTEELNELKSKENVSRIGARISSASSTYSPRKERALKIQIPKRLVEQHDLD